MMHEASRPHPPLVTRLRSESALLTGATGFLGKVVLEKLLRTGSREESLYVLIRPRRGEAAADRLRREVLESPLFDRVSLAAGGREALAGRLVVVEGDVGRDRLGLAVGDYLALTERVTCVINCSANCSFDEPLDRALEVNTLGALRVLRFAADAGDVPLVHVSSCFVCGDREGEIEEAVLPAGHTVRSWMDGGPAAHDLDAELSAMLAEAARLRAAVQAGERDAELPTARGAAREGEDSVARTREALASHLLSERGAERARAGGWGNVYLMSKTLGEQLLTRDRGRVPLSIVRPSIIESTLSEPVPGWTDRMRITALILECGRGTLDAFAGEEDVLLDLVPCDLVANAVLAALPPRGAADHHRVYHVATSHLNPLTQGEASRIIYETFLRRPMHGPDGEPMAPTHVRWVPRETFDAGLELEARRLAELRERLAAEGTSREAREASLRARKVQWLKDFAETYAGLAFARRCFRTDNARALLDSLAPGDRAAFPFDPTAFRWDDYLPHCQVPALLRLQGLHPWKIAPLRQRIRSGAAASGSVPALVREAAAVYGDRTALQTPGDGPGSWIRYSFRELAERPDPLLEVVGREDVPDAELLGELRETLANGASVRRDGVVCVSRNGGDRPPAGQLLAALATGACLTLVD